MFPFLQTRTARLCRLIAVVLAATTFAHPIHAERKERSTKPIVYNYVVKEADPADQAIRNIYGSKYEIVEVRKGGGYVGARLTRGDFPNPVYDKDNEEVAGAVRVLFVITADGRVVDPYIVGQANPLLVSRVLEAIKGYRAAPARVNGKPVAAVEGFKFQFGPAPRRRLDTM